MFILLKVRYNKTLELNITKLQRLNTEDRNWYLNHIIETINSKSKFYKESPITSITFSHGFKNQKIDNKPNCTESESILFKKESLSNSNLNFQKRNFHTSSSLNNKKSLNWTNYIIKTTPSNFSKELLKNNLNKFWKDITTPKVSDNQHIIFMFRLQWIDDQFVTIGNMVKLNNNERDYIFNFILDDIKDKSDYYKETLIKSIVFTYIIKDGRTTDKMLYSKIQYHNYQHHKLPVTMNPLKYGKLLFEKDNAYAVQISDTNMAVITVKDGINEVKIFRRGMLLYEYKDNLISDNTIERVMGNKKWIFKDSYKIHF